MYYMYKLDVNEAKTIVGGEEKCWVSTYSNDGQGNCVKKQMCQPVNKYESPVGSAYTKSTYNESCPVTGKPPITYPGLN